MSELKNAFNEGSDPIEIPKKLFADLLEFIDIKGIEELNYKATQFAEHIEIGKRNLRKTSMKKGRESNNNEVDKRLASFKNSSWFFYVRDGDLPQTRRLLRLKLHIGSKLPNRGDYDLYLENVGKPFNQFKGTIKRSLCTIKNVTYILSDADSHIKHRCIMFSVDPVGGSGKDLFVGAYLRYDDDFIVMSNTMLVTTQSPPKV